MLRGYRIDLGYHAIGGGVFSNLNSVLGEFGEHIDFLESYVGVINGKGYCFPFLSAVDKIKILPYIIRLLYATEKTLNELDSVSISETIRRYGKGKMKLILEIFSRSITTVNDLDRISTGEMFRAQRNLYRGSKPVGYPKKGLGSKEKPSNSLIRNGIDGARKIGINWFNTLMNGVLGDEGKVNRIINQFKTNKECGMVGGRTHNNFNKNKKFVDEVLSYMDVKSDLLNHKFVGGTIFWVDGQIFKKYFTNNVIDRILKKSPKGYVYEPSMNHGVERVFGNVVYLEGKKLFIFR